MLKMAKNRTTPHREHPYVEGSKTLFGIGFEKSMARLVMLL